MGMVFDFFIIIAGVIYFVISHFYNEYKRLNEESKNLISQSSAEYTVMRNLDIIERQRALAWIKDYYYKILDITRNDLISVFGYNYIEECRRWGLCFSNVDDLRELTSSLPHTVPITGLIYNLWLSKYGRYDISCLRIGNRTTQEYMRVILKILLRMQMNMDNNRTGLKLVIERFTTASGKIDLANANGKKFDYKDLLGQNIEYRADCSYKEKENSMRLWTDDYEPRYDLSDPQYDNLALSPYSKEF